MQDIVITISLSDELKSLLKSVPEGLNAIGPTIAAGLVMALGKGKESENTLGKIKSDAESEAVSQSSEGSSDDIGDMPLDVCDPIPGESVTDKDLVELVASIKKRVEPKRIREVFAKYKISCSTACPQIMRPSLVDELKKLADNA